MEYGYMALLVAIVMNLTPEKAFMLLDGKTHKLWTSEEIEDIGKYRAEGMTWKEIAQIFSVDAAAVFRAYKLHKQKGGAK